MKTATNKYALCSSSECEQNCIYFDPNNRKCHIGQLSGIGSIFAENYDLNAFIFQKIKFLSNLIDWYKKAIHFRTFSTIFFYEGYITCMFDLFKTLELSYLVNDLRSVFNELRHKVHTDMYKLF